MDTQKNLFILFGEWLQARHARRQAPTHDRPASRLTGWLPTRGNVLFTLVMIALLVAAQTAGALPSGRPQEIAPTAASTGTIAYQGRLADAAGAPLTGAYNMIFRLYDAASGGTPLWSEQWTGSNGVRVSDGLFNVMLGSLTPLPISQFTNSQSLFLGITVGTDDEMAPRVQLGSVPYAVQALSMPDGSVTTAKIADGAVTQVKLGADVSLTPPDGSITAAKLNLVEGNIGIGTTSANRKLDVRGDSVLYSSNESASEGFNVFFTGASSFGGGLNLHVGSAGAPPSVDTLKGFLRVRGNNNLILGRYNAGDSVALEVSNSNGDIYLAQSTGKVVIGATNPAATLDVHGDFRATGAKSAVVKTRSFGQRELYAIEAPDVRFSDEGMAHLQDGATRVELDPIFLETIEGEYLVHVTPYSDVSLYVAKVGRDYFVVKAREGDANAAFAWRLSATRKGYAGVRLEEVK
jgi:hypothetical protein